MSIVKSDHSVLAELVSGERRVVFVPNVGNLGDALIGHATYSFLATHSIRYQIARVTADIRGACILVGGGGNLIEGYYDDLSSFLARCGRHNRIIILPHTIVGNADLWHSMNGNIQIFARERETLGFLTHIGFAEHQTFLADDMAFWLDGRLPPLGEPQVATTLVCLRGDSESRNLVPPPSQNFDVSALMFNDWADEDVTEHAARMFLSLIARYTHIVTDRLHVAIAGYLMGRTVTLLPNSYYKNRAVYASSMQQAPHVRFVDVLTGDGLPTATWR